MTRHEGPPASCAVPGLVDACCRGNPGATPLAPALAAENRWLLPGVHSCASRRLAQVLAALPHARLASAMLASSGASSSDSRAGGGAGSGADAQDSVLVSRLHWLQEWVQQVAESDADSTCCSMAAACQRLQAGLAAGAMAALQNGSGGDGGLLPVPRQGISIALPKLGDFKLK